MKIVRAYDEYMNLLPMAQVDERWVYVDTPFDDLNGQPLTDKDRAELDAKVAAGTWRLEELQGGTTPHWGWLGD